MNELNENGLLIFKHKTNKRLFLERSYHWVDRIILIDETEGRQVIDSYKFSTYDLSAWTPMTKEEYAKVKSSFKEIYPQEINKEKLNNSLIGKKFKRNKYGLSIWTDTIHDVSFQYKMVRPIDYIKDLNEIKEWIELKKENMKRYGFSVNVKVNGIYDLDEIVVYNP